jgi:hypothetical protein
MSMAELQALVVAINLCLKTQTPGGRATNSPKNRNSSAPNFVCAGLLRQRHSGMKLQWHASIELFVQIFASYVRL